MGDYVHRTTKVFLESVSPNDLPETLANYIESPDLSAVTQDVGPPLLLWPSYYWIITGDVITLEDQAGRDVIDAQRASDADTANRNNEETRIDNTSNEVIFRAIVKVLVDEINTLRALQSLPDRTLAQARTAIKSEISGGL